MNARTIRSALAIAAAGVLIGGCASGSNTRGPGPQTFTLLNDSSANVEAELVTMAGTPSLTTAPGGSATSSIDPETDTEDGVLGVVLLPSDADSGAIGRPFRISIDGPPYSIRVFGTASALRWARVAPPVKSDSELTAPPPPNPGAGVQAR